MRLAPRGHADVAHGPAAGVDRVAGRGSSQALPSADRAISAPALSTGPVLASSPVLAAAMASTAGRSMAMRPAGVGVPRSTVAAARRLGEPGAQDGTVDGGLGGSAVAGTAIAGRQRATSTVVALSGYASRAGEVRRGADFLSAPDD